MAEDQAAQDPDLWSISYNSLSRSDSPTERTSLLFPVDDGVSGYSAVSGGTESDESSYNAEIDPGDFDNLVSRSESIALGLGLEPEFQATAMLQGPRTYSLSRPWIPDRSRASSWQKGSTSIITSNQEVITKDIDERGPERESESPFLAGVSVARFWLIFTSILITYFVACFDSTIMVSSHPVITSYFHSSNSASWLSTAFMLTATSFQPLFGRLSDTIGRKQPYILSMAVFLGATIWCALAQSMLSFIMARALCGFGAGGMITLASIITSDLVPIEIRGSYQSYMNLTFGVGTALGAALGGAIADNLGWRWEFGIQLPILTACLCIAYLTVPSDLGLAVGAQKKSVWEAMKVFDFKGSTLLTTSITFLILGLNLGGNVYPWSHPFVIVSLVTFSITCPLFIWVESYVELPIMPLDLLLKNPRSSLIISNSIGGVVTNAILFNIPLYFQAVLLESATTSGLRLIVPAVSSSLAGTATGFFITWSRNLKVPLIAGATCLFLGSVALSVMGRELPDWAYVLLLIPYSAGQGFMFPATFMSVLAVSDQSEQAVVTSTLVLWRSLGTVLGVATGSLALQNALYYYLEKLIDGPDKNHVIEEVRKSITAIPSLEEPYREQVINSYAASLRATFIMAAVLSVGTVLLTLPLKLPKLGQRK